MKHKGLFWGIMGVSMVVGGVLVVLGMAMGGQINHVGGWIGDSRGHNTVQVEDHTVSAGDETALDGQNIRNLDFNLAAGDITIKTGDGFAISGSKIHSEIVDDGETWYLESPKRKWYHFLSSHTGGDWEITIPRDYQFEKINLSFAAAELDVDGLQAEEIIIDGGAGDADIQNLQVGHSLDLEIAAGSLSVDSGQITGNCQMKCGAGELNLELDKLEGSLDADCGMGEIAMTLPGGRGNYKIDSKASMGQVQIEGGDDDHYGDHQSIWADLNLECGMGEITVNFDD